MTTSQEREEGKCLFRLLLFGAWGVQYVCRVEYFNIKTVFNHRKGSFLQNVPLRLSMLPETVC